MPATDTTPSAWELAQMAECLTPDALTSPGAEFLTNAARALADHDGLVDDDIARELADGVVPVYTHSMWLTFVDLGAYREDISEWGADVDLDRLAGLALSLIAYRLIVALAGDRYES